MYLFVYNAVSLIGWGLVLYNVFMNFGNFFNVAFLVRCVQAMAILEVAHAGLGLTRSPVVTTAMQIASRIFITWVVAIERPSYDGIYGLMITVWALADGIRYAFYLLNLIRMPVAAVTYLRYTAFLVLYPIGVVCEMTLANEWFARHHVNAFISYGILALYPIGLYALYTMMLSQRRKVLK